MRPVDLHQTDRLRAALEAAKGFGLPEHDLWEAAMVACGPESPPLEDDPLDRLTAALAQRILERERSALRARRAP